MFFVICCCCHIARSLNILVSCSFCQAVIDKTKSTCLVNYPFVYFILNYMVKKSVLFIVILLIFFYGYSFISLITTQQYISSTFTAPLPKLLVNTFLQNGTGVLWKPNVKKAAASSEAMPIITALMI